MRKTTLDERAEQDPDLSSYEVGTFEDFCRSNGSEPGDPIPLTKYRTLRKMYDERKRKN